MKSIGRASKVHGLNASSSTKMNNIGLPSKVGGLNAHSSTNDKLLI